MSSGRNREFAYSSLVNVQMGERGKGVLSSDSQMDGFWRLMALTAFSDFDSGRKPDRLSAANGEALGVPDMTDL
jgi:hypothetical protein